MYETLINVLRSEAKGWKWCAGEDALRNEIMEAIAVAFEDLADRMR